MIESEEPSEEILMKSNSDRAGLSIQRYFSTSRASRNSRCPLTPFQCFSDDSTSILLSNRGQSSTNVSPSPPSSAACSPYFLWSSVSCSTILSSSSLPSQVSSSPRPATPVITTLNPPLMRFKRCDRGSTPHSGEMPLSPSSSHSWSTRDFW